MLTETITDFESPNDAEDNLEGVKGLPGFLFGYVKVVHHTNRDGEVVLTKYYLVTVFETSGGHLQKGQHFVTKECH